MKTSHQLNEKNAECDLFQNFYQKDLFNTFEEKINGHNISIFFIKPNFL